MAGTLESARGSLDAAEKRFFEALAIEPRLPAVIAALAQTWSRKQGPWFAGENLMKLAERDPGLSFARYVAARAYVQSRDPIKAEANRALGAQAFKLEFAGAGLLSPTTTSDWTRGGCSGSASGASSDSRRIWIC
jgi:predicted Zn-dependent protease